MKIAVGSTNPVKVNSIKAITESEVRGYEVSSGVSDQPWGDDETLLGAKNRAKLALEKGGADVGIGFEGGVQYIGEVLYVCNWGALIDREGNEVVAGGARLPLPAEIQTKLRRGEELGPVMSEFVSRTDVRKKEGAIGIFTNGAITRTDMFQHIGTVLFGQYEYYRN